MLYLTAQDQQRDLIWSTNIPSLAGLVRSHRKPKISSLVSAARYTLSLLVLSLLVPLGTKYR